MPCRGNRVNGLMASLIAPLPTEKHHEHPHAHRHHHLQPRPRLAGSQVVDVTTAYYNSGSDYGYHLTRCRT